MPICPKCKEEIEQLRHFQKGEHSYDFWLDANKQPFYQSDEFYSNTNPENEWECPECSELLFSSEEEATKFLRGETDSKPAPRGG